MRSKDASLSTMLGVQKASNFLGVHAGTIRRWAQQEVLAGKKIGVRGDWRFSKAALSSVVKNGHRQEIKTKKNHAEAGKRAEDVDTQYQIALLEAQNEATPDGILVVGEKGKILYHNKRFAQMWKIPTSVLQRKSDADALTYALRQLVDPEGFISRVNYIYAHPKEVAHEDVHFTDGRVFDRYGVPVKDKQGHMYGFAWYFRDITERISSEKELQARLRQQAVVTELGQLALTGASLQEIMTEGVKQLHDVLHTEYVKVLELLPGGKQMVLRAGIGWKGSVTIGKSRVDTGKNSQAGYTLLSKRPVVVKDLAIENRFNGPKLLISHRVVSGMSCIIYGIGKPYGVLGVHTAKRRDFSKDDVNFLQAIANLFALVIQRKHNEKQLVYQSRLNNIITQNASLGLMMTDKKHFCTFMNPAAERITGFRFDQVQDAPLHEYVHPREGEYPTSECPFEKSLVSKKRITGEEVFVRKNGKAYPAVFTASPIVIEGVVIGNIIEFRDATEERIAQETLRLSEERYRTVVDNSNDLINLLDLQGNFLYVNPAPSL